MKTISDFKRTIISNGINSISDAETLSVIIGGKNSFEKASNVLIKVNGNYINLSKLSYNDLISEGLSNSQAVRIIAINSYSQRKAIQQSDKIIRITNSKDVADIFMPILNDLPHEEFWILYLNRANNVIGKSKHSQGGIAGTVSDIKIILKKAVELLASGFIICHNHPSGNLNPSEADVLIVKKIKDAALILDMVLMDSIIISDNKYYSFGDEGRL